MEKRTSVHSGESIYAFGGSGRYYRDRLGPTAEQLEQSKKFYQHETIIEIPHDHLEAQGATAVYTPTETEKQYFDRLSKDDRITVYPKAGEWAPWKFQLRGQVGEFVSWFGIVREITSPVGKRGGTLLIENKYFQGYGDAHLQTVSLNGGGNFETDLNKLDEALTPLQLVRVYGTVVREEGNTPVINAQYVRIWPWGEFNFQDYGEDQGDPRWKKNVNLPSGEPVYTHISPEYYIHALGPTDEQARMIKAFAKRIGEMKRARAELLLTKKVEAKP